MAIENRRSTIHPVDVTTSATTKQTKTNRRRSIFTKLVKRSSVEPTFVPAHSDQPISALFSPTRQVHSMDEDYFRQIAKENGNGNGNGSGNGNVNDKGNGNNNVDIVVVVDDEADEFRPPAFLREHLEREREARAAAQKRRHSICASSQRLQAQRMFEKMEKMRDLDDLIQSDKTRTIKLSLTPELAV